MGPEFQFARFMLAYARTRAAVVRGRRDDERGASAIEWAIISAIVVAAAVLIGVAVKNVVTNKKNDMCTQTDVTC
jgi:Flp pilus assembly pilin Flp